MHHMHILEKKILGTYRPYEELIDILVTLPGCSLSIQVNRHTRSGWYPAAHFRAPLFTRNAVTCSGCRGKKENKIQNLKMTLKVRQNHMAKPVSWK